MRSTHSGFLSATAISLALFGCDGPLIATVGRVSDSGSANLDAAVADAMPDAADGTMLGDAAPVDVAPVDASGGPSDAGQSPPLDSACVVLPSSLEVSFSDQITVDSVTVSKLPDGCNKSTVDNLLGRVSAFYARTDGAPLVQAGRLYSLRWPYLVSGVSYRLFGGPATCPEHELVNASADAGGELTSGPGCQEFNAPVDARYLGFGNDTLDQMTLCEGRCDSVDPAKRATLLR